jgi:hypothetical protein
MNGITEVANDSPAALPMLAMTPSSLHRAGQQRKRLAAERVDRALPARRLERLVAGAEAGRVDDLRRAEAAQVVGFGRLAGCGDDLVAALRQHVDRNAADPAGGTVDEDLAALAARVR